MRASASPELSRTYSKASPVAFGNSVLTASHQARFGLHSTVTLPAGAALTTPSEATMTASTTIATLFMPSPP